MVRAKIVACLALAVLSGCSRGPRIIVGSKNFTEQNILGEIVAQHLEKRLGASVERKLNLQGTLLAHQALTTGAIDLYPEYTGTALTAVLKMPPSSNARKVMETVTTEYSRRWNIVWMPPLGFNNTFAMVVRGEMARSEGYKSLSDAAGRKNGWKLGAGYEFLQRPDGLKGLLEIYGLRLQGQPVTMDLGLLYRAIQNKDVDMVAANSTDGMLSVLDLTVLEDDKNYFPPYECSVLVRHSALESLPGLREALSDLFGRIPEATMRRLNYEVDGKRRSAAAVASEFLKIASHAP
jgi:osmoprotectant transport system substrate-binding protein